MGKKTRKGRGGRRASKGGSWSGSAAGIGKPGVSRKPDEHVSVDIARALITLTVQANPASSHS